MINLFNIFIIFLINIYQVESTYYDFIPEKVTTLNFNQHQSFETNCWKEVYLYLNKTKLYMSYNKKKSFWCDDLLLYGNHHRLSLEYMIFPGEKNITLNPNEYADIKYYGMNFFIFQNGLLDSLYSLWDTSKLFRGNEMEIENKKFLEQKMKINLKPSKLKPIPNNLKSGDVFLIRRLDGLDPLIMWGTGSHIGHTAVHINNYIYESTGENIFGKNYWPPPYGFIRTELNEWINNAKKADYDVVVIRLQEKYSKLLDKNINFINNWWEKNKGTPYGFNNFIWGWIDTKNKNFPEPMSSELFSIIISFMYRHNLAKEKLDSFIMEPLNKRLQHYFKVKPLGNFTDILEWTYVEKISLYDLWTLSEQDEWLYNNNYSRVCDTFILTLYKLGGIIPQEIQITEFSPRDFYLTNLFEDSKEQFLGKYKIELPYFNSIKLYQNMNTNCSTIPNEYFRNKNC